MFSMVAGRSSELVVSTQKFVERSSDHVSSGTGFSISNNDGTEDGILFAFRDAYWD
jgi:hypothetical protein